MRLLQIFIQVLVVFLQIGNLLFLLIFQVIKLVAEEVQQLFVLGLVLFDQSIVLSASHLILALIDVFKSEISILGLCLPCEKLHVLHVFFGKIWSLIVGLGDLCILDVTGVISWIGDDRLSLAVLDLSKLVGAFWVRHFDFESVGEGKQGDRVRKFHREFFFYL